MRNEQEQIKNLIQQNDNKDKFSSITNNNEYVNEKLDSIIIGINNIKNKKLRKTKEDKI